MKPLSWKSALCLVLLGGCAASQQPAASTASRTLANPQTSTWGQGTNAPPVTAAPSSQPDTVMALVNGQAITLAQLQAPLIDAYGLPFLLHLAQLEMARQKTREANLTVTGDDVAAERLRTLESCFKESVDRTIEDDSAHQKETEEQKEAFRRQEYERLLPQFLDSQRVTPVEFDLAMQLAAHLRKLAESKVTDQIDDKVLEEAFRIRYGERVEVRHIQLASLQEVAQARQQLDAGVAFEEVARKVSRDPRSAPYGGAIRPFSRAERWWPASFINAAFALKEPGELSDTIKTDQDFHILKLVRKIPPQALKFEDHKAGLRNELRTLMVNAKINELRKQMIEEADRALKIEDPRLKTQFRLRNERLTGAAQTGPQVRRALSQERKPTTAPVGNIDSQSSTPAPAAGRTEVARPPATMPGR